MSDPSQPADVEKEPEPTRKEKRRVGCMTAFVGFAVYALSAFPMSWLARNVQVRFFNEALETIYAPLIFASKIYFAIF